MGEANRRRQQEAIDAQKFQCVARVASAVRRLATANRTKLGADCWLHSELSRALLAEQGLDCELVAGYAAWRIGPGSGDVISHIPSATSYLPPGAQGFAYHAWLEHGGYIIDTTTYQLPRKAWELDAADGGTTTVEWAPEFLLLPKRRIRSYQEVADAFSSGVAYYESNPTLLPVLAKGFRLDMDDLAIARMLMAAPETEVIGINQMRFEC